MSSAAKRAWASRRRGKSSKKKVKQTSKKKAKKKRTISPTRKRKFLAGRKAALAAGWTPFTKMSAKVKAAWKEAYASA